MAFHWQFVDFTFLGNSGDAYLTAVLLILGGIIGLTIIKKLVLSRLHQFASKTKTDFDDLIVKLLNDIHWPLYFLISAYVAVQTLVFPHIVNRVIDGMLAIGISYYVVRALLQLADYYVEKVIKKREKSEKLQEAALLRTLTKVAKVIVWAIAGLLVASNLGYNVTTLIAGLGIGGLAIAFAFQKILEDIFSSISIYFDKPFEVGDFIIVGPDMGTVQKVGIKSTRILALQGEEIVISNRELTSVRIQNFKKMKKRRIAFGFGVTYDTSVAKLKKAKEIVKEVIEKADRADIDRVHFKAFGDFSLNFEVVYYMKTGDYNEYMDTQEEINLGIKERFEKEGIEFAFPTQTIHLSK